MAIVFRRTVGMVTLALFLVLGAGHIFWPHFTINNGSMAPTVPVGNEVILVPSDAYQAGDIITVKAGATYMTHRLMGFGPNGELITRGDANKTNDPLRLDINGQPDPLMSHDVVGKVVVNMPYYTYLLGFWLLAFAALAVWGIVLRPQRRVEEAPQYQVASDSTH